MIGTVMGASRMEVGKDTLLVIFSGKKCMEGSSSSSRSGSKNVVQHSIPLFLWNFHPSGFFIFFTLISMG
jgi:hypothetical protein